MRLTFAVSVFAIMAASALAENEPIPLYEGCQWKSQTVAFNGKANQQLSFRFQDCDGQQAAKATFSLASDNRLMMKWDTVTQPVAQFWALKGEKPSTVIPRIAEPLIEAKEKGRCEVKLDDATRQYSYAPNAAYLEELLARDEPYAACGEYGDTNDGIQYFRTVGDTFLAFLWVGQNVPLFDPDSFVYQNSEKPGIAE